LRVACVPSIATRANTGERLFFIDEIDRALLGSSESRRTRRRDLGRNNQLFFLLKVYTRNARGIRGHIEAYVTAFDKFWNLALEDCFEIWSRKVKRKAPALGTIVRGLNEIVASQRE
jgi:small nuclear ribonucleoprotein (snRNP)-like protein